MTRLLTLLLVTSALVVPWPAGAGSVGYERPYPLRITPVPAEARAFYIEFRAREDGTFGHSYVALGASDSVAQSVVVGFMPKGRDDDYLSKVGIPVAGLVGMTRSDLLRRPNVRFRVAITRSAYIRVLHNLRTLRRTWATYQLVARNCNSFVGEVAASVGLVTPRVTAQYPVGYVAELRALNSH